MPANYTLSSSNAPVIATTNSRNCILVGNGGTPSEPDTWSATNAAAPSGGKRWIAFKPDEDCSVTITVLSTSSGRTFYLYDKDHHSTSDFVSSKACAATNTWYTWDVELTGGTWYAISASGSGTYVNAMSFEAAASCDAAPTAPTGLSAGSITASGATFTITDGANTNNYEIYCSTSSTAPIASTVATATGTSKTIAVSGLTPSSTYYAWVRSVCDATYKSAWVALTGTTFNTSDCPSSGTIYEITVKNPGSNYNVPTGDETNLVSTYATVTGGGAYAKSKSSAGNIVVTTTGEGTLKLASNDGYAKLVLDCPIQTGDVLSFESGSGSYQLAFTTNDTRATTYSSTSNTYTFPAAFNGVSTIYIWRAAGSTTYMHSLEITRSGGCTVSSAEAGANKTTTAETGVALAATAAGTGKTGTWSITSKPDGSSASASSFSSVNSATATFTPDKVGNYTLTWTVECDEDDTETASDNMTVTANCIAISPSLSYASVGGTTLDVGDSSSGSPTVSGNTGSGTVSYEVTSASPAGCLTVNPSTGIVSAVAAGTATVTATIVASGNYCGNTATANFTIADDCTDPGLTITLN